MMKQLSNNFLLTSLAFCLAVASARPIYQIRAEVQHDSYPDETSWRLTKNGSPGPLLVLSQPEKSITIPNSYVLKEAHVEPGRYRFEIADSYTDGICCGHGPGYYKLIVNGYTLFCAGNFGRSDVKEFTITDYGHVIEHNLDPEPVREYRLDVQYPLTGQGETRVKVMAHSNERVAMFDRSPNTGSGEYRSEVISLVPGEEYRLVLVDRANNGMPGGFAFVSMYEDGAPVQILALINGDEFSFKGIERFVVPHRTRSGGGTAKAMTRTGNLRGTADEESCQDTDETFVLRGVEHTCDWPHSASFCDLDLVEKACRKTCRKCGVEDSDSFDDDDDEEVDEKNEEEDGDER